MGGRVNLKNREVSKKLIMFFNEYQIPDEFFVPFLVDGFYETEVLTSKTFYCDFYSTMFCQLWNDLVYNRNLLVGFLYQNKPIDVEILKEHLTDNQVDSLLSVSLLSYLYEAGPNELLKNPTSCHSESILIQLRKQVTNIKKKEGNTLPAFQDLKFLSDEQIKNCYNNKKFVFISEEIEKINKEYPIFEIDDSLFLTWKL
tara:strand:- start:495 stop:1094 length:600 start_codon:yes stop_codon:yes gene_type:complete